jgi:hypothetical protein
VAGWIRPHGSVLVIEPDADSRGGVAVNGVKSVRPVPIQTDRFHLSLGDRALEIDGYRRLRRADRPAMDLSGVLRGRPAGLGAPASIGYGQPACAIDFVRLFRASNYPLHEYLLVYRQLILGSAADAGLQIPGGDVEGEHAVIIFEGGEAFLAPAEGEVRVSPSGGRPGAGDPGEEVILPAGSLYPVTPGMEVILGSARIKVDAGAAEWYKKVE